MVQEAQSSIIPVQSSSNPANWWQWVVMYPTLFVSILGNIPQLPNVLDIWGANGGISFFTPIYEREQAKYWLANLDCMMKPSQSLKTNQPDNVAIDVTLCPKTGDMLVSLQDANPKDGKTVKPIRRWVKVTAPSENALASFLMPSAIAATVPDLSKQISQPDARAIAQVTVLCQKLLGDNKILRRLQYPDGRCVDEVVNTLTGEVVSQTASNQCSAGC
jgi:hypothetical protein